VKPAGADRAESEDAMSRDLDLDRTLRPGLDILANEIVISLKKRLRFPHNPEIYAPGLVAARPDLSLLMYELGQMERVHAELGRYSYSDQESFTDVSRTQLVIRRPAPPSPICNVPTGLADDVIGWYLGWIAGSCRPGSDSDAYGETVTADVTALMNLLERITLGKFVAEYKYKESPEMFRQTGGDQESIRGMITHPEREKQVLEMAERLAAHYEFDPALARGVFAWLITATVEVQIRYIRHRMTLDRAQGG